MSDLFTEEYYYWCEHCENYSMSIISIETSFYQEHAILKCAICGESDEHSILINY